MAEPPGLLAGDLGRRGQQQLTRHQRVEAAAAVHDLQVVHERQHAAEMEVLALDRGSIEQRPLLRGEQVETGGQQRVQRGGRDGGPGRSATCTASCSRKSGLPPARAATAVRCDSDRPLRAASSRRLSSGLSGPRCTVVTPAGPSPRRASGEQFGAGEAQQQHRRVDQLCAKVVHEVEQRRLRPMDVLEQQHQRAVMRDSAEEQPECPGRSTHPAALSPRPSMAVTEAAAAGPSAQAGGERLERPPVVPPGEPSRGPASR